MNALGLQPLFEAFGWMFIHSLWQGLLIFGVLKIFLKTTKNQTAGFRYTLILISMIAMSTWAILTFVNYFPNQLELNGTNGFATSALSDTDPETVALSEFFFQNPDSWGLSIRSFLPLAAPWVFTLWLIGVGIMGIRLMGNFLYLNQLKRLKSFPAGPDLQRIVQNLVAKAGIKRAVHLRISNRIFEPITFGFLKPVILLPASILSHIPPDQLEALILHEMAHIHRFDYLVNLIQTILEICFFYHPVVWWLSTQLRDERELSCDEWVITYGAEKSEYAQALIFLEKQKLSFRNQLAMSAKGNKSSLTQRILRLYETQSASPSFARGIFAFILLVILFTGLVIGPRLFLNKYNSQKSLIEIYVPEPPAPPAPPLAPPPPPPPIISEIIVDENIDNNWKIIPKGSGVVISPEFGLYVVNGQEGGKELLEKVTRTNIQSAEALGPIDAMKTYGPKGKNGAFIIHTSDQPLMEDFYFGNSSS
ncbi:MAG: M56 family metallopeptidase, partial [Bacteroidetes bacterium]|nr:M56 family metallopeptidase [Bacteroidota bacterium]